MRRYGLQGTPYEITDFTKAAGANNTGNTYSFLVRLTGTCDSAITFRSGAPASAK